jgi:hypothetical protein
MFLPYSGFLSPYVVRIMGRCVEFYRCSQGCSGTGWVHITKRDMAKATIDACLHLSMMHAYPHSWVEESLIIARRLGLAGHTSDSMSTSPQSDWTKVCNRQTSPNPSENIDSAEYTTRPQQAERERGRKSAMRQYRSCHCTTSICGRTCERKKKEVYIGHP